MFIACFCGAMFETLDEDFCPYCGYPHLDLHSQRRYEEMREELLQLLDSLPEE